jgi:hypothetical protein
MVASGATEREPRRTVSTDERRRIVWVLGAGFSAPLGAPLLQDMFSNRAYEDLRVLHGERAGCPAEVVERAGATLFSKASNLMRQLYAYGMLHAERPPGSAREAIWTNAEDFIDTLETAATESDSALAHRLNNISDNIYGEYIGPEKPRPTLPELRDAGRRLLAAECSAFLLNAAPLASERWDPYKRWKNEVLNCAETVHTIITFNYDRLLEVLGLAKWVDLPQTAATSTGLVRVLKLHGSVDWKRAAGQYAQVQTRPAYFHLTCADDELAIAPPGPDKRELANSGLRPLWDRALEELGIADAVFFVGYRFPPTDALARRELLHALNARASVHIVLGPKVSDDVVRLRELLQFFSPSVPPQVHRMWSQDFLSCCPTGLLF